MRPDKDKPWTWIRYKNGMCEGCFGNCCTMPVEIHASDLIRLGLTDEDEVQTSKKKLAKRLIKEKIVQSYREGTDLFMLSARPDGDCVFLNPKTRLCTVYDRRPDTCRGFPLALGPRPGFCPRSSQDSL